MKKTALMIWLGLLMLVMVACAQSKEEGAEVVSEETVAESAEATEDATVQDEATTEESADAAQETTEEVEETVEEASQTEAETTSEEAAGEVGIFFEEREGTVVYCTDVPEPGMTFPVHTEGSFAVTIYVVDADGNKLGDLTVEEGLIDYGMYAENGAKVIVENGAAADYAEYIIPTSEEAAGEVGIFFEEREGTVVYCTDVPEPGMTFPVHTEGSFAVTIYVVDADGNKLGDLTVEEGLIDYGMYAENGAKVIVENGAAADYAEYIIPQ